MNNDGGKKADHVSSSAVVTRHRRRNFTEEVYGARLPYDDARIIDDYAKANKLDRSEAVRQGLHQFALRQKMIRIKKDPLRESLEQVVAEQIAPLRERADEVMVLLSDLVNLVVERGQNPPDGHTKDGGGGASLPLDEVSVAPPYAHVLKEQKQLLERTLMAVMLALRLHVNYLIEPVLSASEARSSGEVERHLRAAIMGTDLWCETTRKVVTRTGKRILFESNLMTKEEWERLLAEYRAEDQKEGMK